MHSADCQIKFPIFRKIQKFINILYTKCFSVNNMSKIEQRECCKIDAIVTVDAKGQIVLPKDLRDRGILNQTIS